MVKNPDVTNTPIPRFDLLEFDAYAEMSVQFSRGCPFQYEFCDIIVLYGRKPRTKTPAQHLAELDYLYELGWRRSIFIVDDNFIGNKRNVKLFLKELQPWMVAHHYPFSFATEASVDLAQDQELMDAMVRCNFGAVFLGIETPDEESLTFTQKFQNTRDSLTEGVNKITRSGLRVMAGFIMQVLLLALMAKNRMLGRELLNLWNRQPFPPLYLVCSKPCLIKHCGID